MQILVSSFIYYPSHLKCLIFSQMHISRKCFVKAQSQSYSHILLDVDFDNANEEKKEEEIIEARFEDLMDKMWINPEDIHNEN